MAIIPTDDRLNLEYRNGSKCLCNVLGNDDYIKALAVFGMVWIGFEENLEIIKPQHEKPLLVIQSHILFQLNKLLTTLITVSPHIERDMKFCMSLLNLQINILLLAGVKYDILAFYLVYLIVEMPTVTLHLTYAILLFSSQMKLLPWQIFLLGFRTHNVLQVVCSFHNMII
ncbi:uncharacterized protein LOC111053866 isoform X2 [Nilaparvata lugens]|uniref:uncharacterized protein LOC111053866 isoform X2 n=1 Tax=Nilaparvata lugens TaxID=108931 RepID=UPI00193E736D|nr:uncharacterized protein LOC111053866 isoform X2 [Nilaparvata lugens]